MNIQNKEIKDITIITIEGVIDTATAPKIMKHINDLISMGACKLVMDLTSVPYTSSAGLRVLLGTVKETRAKGGDLFLFGIQSDVEKVLRLSGFTSILKVFPDKNTALKNFS